MWKRLKNSRHHILKQAGIWTGSVYAILGFLRMFVSLEGLFDSSASFWNKLLISFIILLGVWCLFLEKPRARDPLRRRSLTPFAEIDLTPLS